MDAKLLIASRDDVKSIADAFMEQRVWELTTPVAGSRHRYKYRLALVVRGECVLRYDNEIGKGDHKHVGRREFDYAFSSIDQLFTDFLQDVEKWTMTSTR